MIRFQPLSFIKCTLSFSSLLVALMAILHRLSKSVVPSIINSSVSRDRDVCSKWRQLIYCTGWLGEPGSSSRAAVSKLVLFPTDISRGLKTNYSPCKVSTSGGWSRIYVIENTSFLRRDKKANVYIRAFHDLVWQKINVNKLQVQVVVYHLSASQLG